MKPTISSASGPSRTPAPNQPQPLRFLLDAIIAAPTPHNSHMITATNIRDNARLLSADQLCQSVPHNAPTALQLHAVLSVIFHRRTASISEPTLITHEPAAPISSAPPHYNCAMQASVCARRRYCHINIHLPSRKTLFLNTPKLEIWSKNS